MTYNRRFEVYCATREISIMYFGPDGRLLHLNPGAMIEHDAHLIPQLMQVSIYEGMPKSVETEGHVETDLRSLAAPMKPAIVRKWGQETESPSAFLKFGYRGHLSCLVRLGPLVGNLCDTSLPGASRQSQSWRFPPATFPASFDFIDADIVTKHEGLWQLTKIDSKYERIYDYKKLKIEEHVVHFVILFVFSDNPELICGWNWHHETALHDSNLRHAPIYICFVVSLLAQYATAALIITRAKHLNDSLQRPPISPRLTASPEPR
ncbi:uncharacterized protein CLUP02_13545 [Colletotrichum lupini]|uniref:Uncharacterized protein n=1 Tax=Colletotrichum lupini TaxID=145971 RepID=A0A9Q8T342_9PEZI|nr:uncharacterized protein CLUP02_13545 [Colletotrichum lupini]UQC88023.1 hypothetical protein CLUP02_13545 [Colletotrichum lupini]